MISVSEAGSDLLVRIGRGQHLAAVDDPRRSTRAPRWRAPECGDTATTGKCPRHRHPPLASGTRPTGWWPIGVGLLAGAGREEPPVFCRFARRLRSCRIADNSIASAAINSHAGDQAPLQTLKEKGGKTRIRHQQNRAGRESGRGRTSRHIMRQGEWVRDPGKPCPHAGGQPAT